MEEILIESFSALEALCDLHKDYDTFCEEQVRLEYNYRKTKDLQVVEEGLGDILQFIVESFRRFVGKIRDLCHKLIMAMNSLGMEYSKLIEKYGEELKRMEIPEKEIEGFRYSTLSVNPPNVELIYQLLSDFNNHISKFDRMTTEEIRTMYNDAMAEISLGRLRGKLIGDGGRIEADGLRSHIYQMYRSGCTYPVKITVTKEMIADIVDNSKALLQEKKLAGQQKLEILNLLQRMEKFFSVSLTDLYDDVDKSYSIHGLTTELSKKGYESDQIYRIREAAMQNFSMYMTMRYNQVMEMSNVMTVLFTERLGAIKDQIDQERQIINMMLRFNVYVLGAKSVKESFVPEALAKANSYPIVPNPNWAPILENVGGV